MKKWILCLVLVIGIMVTGCGEQSEKVTVDGLCPFTMQTTKDGILNIEIDNSAFPEGKWNCETTWDELLEIVLEEKDTMTKMTVKGLNAGSETIRLSRVDESAINEYGYWIEIVVRVDDELNAVVDQYFTRGSHGKGTADETAEIPYRWEIGSDNVYTVLMEIDLPGSWNVTAENENVCYIENVAQEEEGVSFDIVLSEVGTTVVLIENNKIESHMEMHVTVENETSEEGETGRLNCSLSLGEVSLFDPNQIVSPGAVEITTLEGAVNE